MPADWQGTLKIEYRKVDYMTRNEANCLRGLLTVVDSELDGSRKMVGAMLTMAETLEKRQVIEILREVRDSVSRAFDMVSTDLAERDDPFR